MGVTDRVHYVSRLQCYVLRFSYDFAVKTGEIWMPADSCTDMNGAIEWFRDIDEGVTAVITWADGKLDTTYIKDAQGMWHGTPPCLNKR